MNIQQALLCSKALGGISFESESMQSTVSYKPVIGAAFAISQEAAVADDWEPVELCYKPRVEQWLKEQRHKENDAPGVLYVHSTDATIEEAKRIIEQTRSSGHIQIPKPFKQQDNQELQEMTNLLLAVNKGFMTCISQPDRDPKIEITFPSLEDAQLAHRLLCGLNADYTKTVAYQHRESELSK